MNDQEPNTLLQQLLLALLRGIWYVVNQNADFRPTLQEATGLRHRQLESLLVKTQIIQPRAGQNVVSSRGLTHFQAAFPLCTQLHVTQTRFNRGGQNYTFLCVGPPNHNSTPRTQSSDASRRDVSHHRRSNPLDPQLVAAINELTDLHEEHGTQNFTPFLLRRCSGE